MSKLMIALFVTAGLGFAVPGMAQTYAPKSAPTTMSKESYTMAKTNADAQYKIDKDACSSASGNAKDICMAEAKGKDNVAKANAQASYENTPKARQNARVTAAEASYKVAIEKCDDLAGNRTGSSAVARIPSMPSSCAFSALHHCRLPTPIRSPFAPPSSPSR